MDLFKEYNNGLKTGKSKTVGSMDIKSFYPSIDPVRAAKVAKLMWNDSELKLENINWDALSMYVGKMAPKKEILKENLSGVVYKKD